MAELIRILDKIMKDHFSKAAARQEKRKDEDYDEVSILAVKTVHYVFDTCWGYGKREWKEKMNTAFPLPVC